jgi:hypothetical protein
VTKGRCAAMRARIFARTRATFSKLGNFGK